MVADKTEWIACTQRLAPARVEIRSHNENPDLHRIFVPNRSRVWYAGFTLIIWGIPIAVAVIFLLVSSRHLINLGVLVGCIFVATVLSVERRISISTSSRTMTIDNRIAFLPGCSWKRSFVFVFQMAIEAVQARDVEGLRQVEIVVLDGRNKLEILLTFGGWNCLPEARVLAEEINNLLSDRC